MVDLFAEAIRTAALPCSLGLIVPALVVTLVGGRHALVAAFGAFAGTFAVVWLRITGILDVSDLVATALLVAGALIAWVGRRDSELAGIGGIFVGAFGAATWLPCVGREFGTVLNEAPGAPTAALLPALVYVLGVLLIVFAVTAVPYAVPRLADDRARRGQSVIGGVLAAALVGAVVFGVYDDVLGELAARSVDGQFRLVDG